MKSSWLFAGRRSGPRRLLKLLGFSAAGLVLLANLPDLIRYLKIERM